jgi:peptide chain release factor 1
MNESSEDKDMLNMATEEMSQAIEEERKLQNLLLKSLLPKDDADERDCILEVRAGKLSLLKMEIYCLCSSSTSFNKFLSACLRSC